MSLEKKINVAVVGATGAVGTAMLEILSERSFPINEFYPLASANSEGKTINFNRKSYYLEDAEKFDFSKVDIALFSAGGEVSLRLAPKAAAAGCIVIDNTSAFRYEDDVPLVIPEVNPEQIANYKNKNIIANPNCSTIQMLVALKPIYDKFGIKRIDVATYQAVSGTGRAAVTELVSQTGQLLNGRPAEPKIYPRQIAFNVIPEIDIFYDNGFTKEELKMLWETQKILGDPKVHVNATAVRVPVLYGHSEAITVTTSKPIKAADAKILLSEAPGVEIIEGEEFSYPTAIDHGGGSDAVFVGRIRNDLQEPNILNLWVVADNVRKGAALNAVQIAEILFEKYIII